MVIRPIFSVFLFFSLFFLSFPASAETCSQTGVGTVAVGEACGSLGATQMLSNGTAIVACLVADPTQTGTPKTCTWSSMNSSGGNSGGPCGLSIRYTNWRNGTVGYYTAYADLASCNGKTVLVSSSGEKSNCPSGYTLSVVSMNGGTTYNNNNNTYYKTSPDISFYTCNKD